MQGMATPWNNLAIELDKTELVYFHKPWSCQAPSPNQLYLLDPARAMYYKVTPKVMVLYLGFFINHKLDWEPHVTTMCNRARASIHQGTQSPRQHTLWPVHGQLEVGIQCGLPPCSLIWQPTLGNFTQICLSHQESALWKPTLLRCSNHQCCRNNLQSRAVQWLDD